MRPREHHQEAKRRVACAIVTVSDTRTIENDESGRTIRTLLEEAGHGIISHRVARDEPTLLHDHILLLITNPGVEAVLLTGGTGIAPRDTTFEAVRSLLQKEIEGFGELFRMLSYQEVGSAAMLSRAVAGISSGKVIVSMPGSPAAVELAMRKLVIPELGHMLHLLRG